MNYIGIDIGGTKCAVSLGTPEGLEAGTLMDRVEFPTAQTRGPEATIRQFCAIISALLQHHALQPADIGAIGISCGGPLDSKTGMILSPPNLIGWDNVPVVQMLRDAFGIKTYLQNDANACALAEWKYGAGAGTRDMVFLTFGTGLGAGIIADGRLIEGASGMAGEVGHVRLAPHGPVGYGKEGSFEGFCSGGGIAQIARTKVLEQLQSGQKPSFCSSVPELDNLNAKMVAEAAAQGDPVALAVYDCCGEKLGYGLSMLIDILNPEAIVIGSVFARAESLLRKKMQAVIHREALAYSAECCKILPAKLGDRLGDFAAISVAVYGLEREERAEYGNHQ